MCFPVGVVREGLNSAAGNTKLTSKYISPDRKAAVLTRMFTITSIKSAAQVELLRTRLISVRLGQKKPNKFKKNSLHDPIY